VLSNYVQSVPQAKLADAPEPLSVGFPGCWVAAEQWPTAAPLYLRQIPIPYKCSAVAEIGDRMATIDTGRKLGAVPLVGGELVPM